jgi:hypothetical protein
VSLESFIAGRYSGTWNAVDVGITEEGYELFQDTHAELVNQTDAFGESLIDWVWRGGSVYMMLRSLAAKPGAITPFYPYGGSTTVQGLGTLFNPGVAGTPFPIGSLASDLAKAMVLTATASTPATGVGAGVGGVIINTLTAALSLLKPGSNLSLLFNSKLRKVPLALQILPKSNAGPIYQWWTTT